MLHKTFKNSLNFKTCTPFSANIPIMQCRKTDFNVFTVIEKIFKPAPNMLFCPHRKLHQQFEMYKDQVKKLGEEPPAAQTARAESPTCGICHKTKFADGCGRACCYCQSRFCARCGGRVPLRANKVSCTDPDTLSKNT